MTKENAIRKQECRNRQEGFTIIEVMIALSILAIGLLSVAAMQLHSTNKNTSANRTTRAFVWCSDRMEILKNLPYTDANLIGAPAPGMIYSPSFRRLAGHKSLSPRPTTCRRS